MTENSISPQIVKLTAQHTIKLPPDLAGRFRPGERFIVWAEGDMLHLKRITPPPVTGIVEQAQEGEPLSLEQINEIVHEVRRQSKSS